MVPLELKKKKMIDRAAMLKLLNNNVISQTISEGRKFLFAGNRDGDIFVLSITELDDASGSPCKLRVYPQGADIEVNSLCFFRNFLIVGAIGVIYGLEWLEEKQQLSKDRRWEIKIPIELNAIEVPEINSMFLDKDREILFAGCGDNIYQIDLEGSPRIMRTYVGHSDYIHSVVADGARIYSASEDGTVRIWNERENTHAQLDLNANANLVRPELGGFVGAVAVNDDWLLCGGGPKLSLFHLGTLKCAQVFDFPGRVHVADFVENEIVVGGEHRSAHIYGYDGELLADIPLDLTAAFSIAWQLEPLKFMSIAGYDNQLHILKQFRFLDRKIPCYGNIAEDCDDNIELDDEPTDRRRKER